MIHGGAPGAFGWGNFGQNLAGLSRRFRVLIVDLPGYGKSDKPTITGGGKNTFYASVFTDLLRVLGVTKAHLLGLATGGATAMKMAIDSPDLVDRLILVSSSGGLPLFTPTPSPGGAKVIANYYQGEGPSREKMRAYLELIVSNKDLITDDLVEERYRASVDPEFLAASPPEGKGRPPKAEPIWRDVDRITAKTLLIWGGRDNVVQGYDNALFLLNRIPDSQVHIYAGTGLWVPFERQAEFETQVESFLIPPSAAEGRTKPPREAASRAVSADVRNVYNYHILPTLWRMVCNIGAGHSPWFTRK